MRNCGLSRAMAARNSLAFGGRYDEMPAAAHAPLPRMFVIVPGMLLPMTIPFQISFTAIEPALPLRDGAVPGGATTA